MSWPWRAQDLQEWAAARSRPQSRESTEMSVGKSDKKEGVGQNSPTGAKEVNPPCTKLGACHHEAGSPGPNYQSAQATSVAVSQGLPFLREPEKFFTCLEQVTGERRTWGPRFLGTH